VAPDFSLSDLSSYFCDMLSLFCSIGFSKDSIEFLFFMLIPLWLFSLPKLATVAVEWPDLSTIGLGLYLWITRLAPISTSFESGTLLI